MKLVTTLTLHFLVALARLARLIKPSTLLKFHAPLVKKKYQLLYASRHRSKPGPKGPSKETIGAVVEMKNRNPRYGCPRIAQQINLAFELDLNKDVVRRILAKYYRPDSGKERTFVAHHAGTYQRFLMVSRSFSL